MSEVKVNKISPRTACGTVTLGDSGDTFTIPSGATINNQGTAVNFGATGSASWVTTVKTSTFTAVAGEGYFVNTTGGVVTVNLPAGTAGAVVAIKDYAGTFDTNAVTLVQNGSDKIGGSTVNATLITEGIAVTLVFIDSTQGWLVTDSGLQTEAPTAEYITATGGTITTVDTNFKVHTFTGPGTFTVTNAGEPGGSNTVSYMVVAGGGGAGYYYGAAGGAGGFRESKAATDTYTASPLNATSGPTYNLPVSVQGYPVVIGGGGAARGSGSGSGPATAGSGTASSALAITSAGGGGGSGGNSPGGGTSGISGGSGGGGGGASPGSDAGSGNTPPVSPPQGNSGEPSSGNRGGSGGGAIEAGGTDGTNLGGDGATTSINGTPTAFAGGGGGSNPGQAGGDGGGSTGGSAQPGAANTGGGQGGCSPAGAGGSGIVIIRYKFQ